MVNIGKAKRGYRIYGNTGSKVVPNIATMGGLGKVVFDDYGPANVFLAKMGKIYRIPFDSWGGNTFAVHKSNRNMIEFQQHPCGLYYHDTADRKIEHADDTFKVRKAYQKSITFITTVANNMKIFTYRQIERVKEVRRAYGNRPILNICYVDNPLKKSLS